MKSKIKHIIKEELIKELSKRHIHENERLDEMARVGFLGNNYDVIVWTDDPGFISHVHCTSCKPPTFEQRFALKWQGAVNHPIVRSLTALWQTPSFMWGVIDIRDTSTRGQEFDTCVMLETNKYFLHNGHVDKMNSKMCKAFDDFMRQPSRNVHYRNNYEHAVNLWNDNNSEAYIQIKEDEDGNIIMSDYKHIFE